MKNDKEYKRLVRLLAISWGLLIFFMIIFMWWVTAQLVNVRNSLLDMQSNAPQSIKTVNGIDGKDGVSIQGERGAKGEKGDTGANGLNGKDSISTFQQETIIKEVPIQGPQGEKGEPGQPARNIEIAKDKKDNLMWRYEGDEEYQPVPEVK